MPYARSSFHDRQFNIGRYYMNKLSYLFVCKKAIRDADSHSDYIDNQLLEDNERQSITSSIVILGSNDKIIISQKETIFLAEIHWLLK